MESEIRRWMGQPSTDADLIPAATVIPLRDGPQGLEVLLLRRDRSLSFASGMWVFPGGRIDPEDRLSVNEPELEVARRAACREAREEANIACSIDEMLLFSHWTPPQMAAKRFSTWFFATTIQNAEVEIDDGEIRAHRWFRPADAMSSRDAGEIELAPPTFMTLFRLAAWSNVTSALEAIANEPIEFFQTKITSLDDDLIAMYHGDAGYEDEDPAADGARHRLVMAKTGWVYERTELPSAQRS